MGSVAMLFAGQGAQAPGMGRDIVEAEPSARELFERLETKMPGISNLCFEGNAQELAQTKNTQPCVWAVDLACAYACAAHGVRPAHVAGFSLGEFAALAFVGALREQAAFDLVLHRAALMDEACLKNPGAMCAVLKLAADEVESLAQQADAWPVNYNSPAQTVCAGSEDAITKLEVLVKEAGGRAMRLAVSGAFHSPYMQAAAEGLARLLDESGEYPLTPSGDVVLWSNVTGEPYPNDPRAMGDLVARQVKSPVLWTKTLLGMAQAGVDTFIEVGPGKVLTGLVKKTIPDACALHVETRADLDDVLKTLRERDALEDDGFETRNNA